MMDEMLLDTIADHCRAGLKTLFQQGFTTGAIPVGYRRVEVPGAPLTNRGLPRTMPQVDPEVAKLIKQHYEWIRDGMTIKEGWRRWVAAGGPCDPRSILSTCRTRRTGGCFATRVTWGAGPSGGMKNRWSSKRDYNRQIEQPETEVAIYRCEELRILDDELFLCGAGPVGRVQVGPAWAAQAEEGRSTSGT